MAVFLTKINVCYYKARSCRCTIVELVVKLSYFETDEHYMDGVFYELYGDFNFET